MTQKAEIGRCVICHSSQALEFLEGYAHISK